MDKFEIEILSNDLVETLDKEGNKSIWQVVMYKLPDGGIGKLTFTDVPVDKDTPKEVVDFITSKNIDEAKKEIKKALKNNWKDQVIDIEI